MDGWHTLLTCRKNTNRCRNNPIIITVIVMTSVVITSIVITVVIITVIVLSVIVIAGIVITVIVITDIGIFDVLDLRRMFLPSLSGTSCASVVHACVQLINY